MYHRKYYSFNSRNNFLYKTKEKNHTLVKVILTFLSVWIFALLITSIPVIHKTEIEKYIEDYAEEYMTTKYGDGDFKVVNIAKDFDGGFWEPEVHSGYYVKIKNSYTDGIISMFIDGTTKETIEVSYDGLLLDYYEEIDEEYGDIVFFQKHIMQNKSKLIESKYKNDYGLDIDFNIDCYYKVPDNYGHIPTIDELVELCPINTKHLSIKINDHVELRNELNYLKRLAKYSMEYFANEEEVNIYYELNYRKGFVKINYSTVTIKIDDTERIYSKEEIKNFTN